VRTLALCGPVWPDDGHQTEDLTMKTQRNMIIPAAIKYDDLDEAAVLMQDALNRLLAKPGADAGRVRLYRCICALLDSASRSIDGTTAAGNAADVTVAMAGAVDGGAGLQPSATQPAAQLVCKSCGFSADASAFVDGRECPAESLRADFFGCPQCFSADIAERH
jgi:hypothetical protein